MYVFSYFTEQEEKLYLALSEDSYTWEVVHGGLPVWISGVGTKRLRDPFIQQDTDGIFHLIWTDGWTSRSIGYARSVDLIHWEDERLIPVMEHLPEAQNAWAPEMFYDSERQGYRIIWSSTVGAGARDHRIWSTTTRDFTEFSEAQLFFDPGYNVIDSTVKDLGDCYFMLFKDERGTNDPDTAYKAIRSCIVAKEDSDQPSIREISGLLTPALTEGPTLYAVPGEDGNEWIMLVDRFQDHQYAPYRSSDLKVWEELSGKLQLPKGARHGSVFKLNHAIKIP